MRIPVLTRHRVVLAIFCAFSLLATVLSLSACTDYWRSAKIARELFRSKWSSAEWREEVQLSDGRVIEITQQRQYEETYDGHGRSNIVRDAWIRFRLPETGFKEVVWHEQLIGMRFDVVDGKPFIVAYPATGREFDRYGKPIPAYLGFIYEHDQWHRVPFSEIPESQYDFNLVADRILPDGMTRLSLTEKNSKKFNGSSYIYKPYKRITQRFGEGW
jgi:hypothetical protein